MQIALQFFGMGNQGQFVALGLGYSRPGLWD